MLWIGKGAKLLNINNYTCIRYNSKLGTKLTLNINNKNLTSVTLFLFTLVLTFSLGEVFYNSIDGTDFYRYFDYIKYFRGGLDSPGREQGLLYYWFISLFIKFSRSYYIPSDWESIYSSAIQFGNLFLYCLGLIGLYFLLKSYSYLKHEIFFTLTILNCFPPLMGARLIMKPEILAFSLLPWILLTIDYYFKTKELKYLLYSTPLISILLTSKGSIIGITVFSLIYLYLSDIKSIKYRDLTIASLVLIFISAILFIENSYINGYNTFTHLQTEQYLNRATFSFIYNINFQDLFNNPYRNAHANSFAGITLIDTFGDYFDRYWDHERSLFSRNRIEFFNNNNLRRQTSIIASLIFIIGSFYKKNSRMLKHNYLYLLGAFTLLLSAYGVFGLNFNPEKGDTLKTHYYSFVLAISFAVFIINYLSRQKIYLQILSVVSFVFIFLFISGFPKTYSGQYNEVLTFTEALGSKVETSISCEIISGYIDSKTGLNSDCLTQKNALCGSFEVYNVPIKHEDGYLIFIPDELFTSINLTDDLGNRVTVSGYAECINYQEGGYKNIEAKSWGQTNQIFNQITALISLISILLIANETRKNSNDIIK